MGIGGQEGGRDYCSMYNVGHTPNGTVASNGSFCSRYKATSYVTCTGHNLCTQAEISFQKVRFTKSP